MAQQAPRQPARAVERKLVNVADDQHVGAVEVGIAVAALVTVCIRQDFGERRRIIAQTRERVRRHRTAVERSLFGHGIMGCKLARLHFVDSVSLYVANNSLSPNRSRRTRFLSQR
jgi:hypothetical protein